MCVAQDYKDLSPKLETTLGVQGTVRSFRVEYDFRELTDLEIHEA